MKKQATQWGNNQTKLKHGTLQTTGLDSSKDSITGKREEKDSWGGEIKTDLRDMVIKCNMWTYLSSGRKKCSKKYMGQMGYLYMI